MTVVAVVLVFYGFDRTNKYFDVSSSSCCGLLHADHGKFCLNVRMLLNKACKICSQRCARKADIKMQVCGIVLSVGWVLVIYYQMVVLPQVTDAVTELKSV